MYNQNKQIIDKIILQQLQKMSKQVASLKCFYHPQQNLTNICLHQQCLLPLCKKCKIIHQQKYKQKNNQDLHRIVLYQQAKNMAINNIKQQQQRIQQVIHLLQQTLQEFDKKFDIFKVKIIQMLEQELKYLRDNMKNNILQFDKDLKQAKDEQKNILGNNISTLLKHYEKKNTTNQFQWKFNNQINRKNISSLISNSFKVQKIDRPTVTKNLQKNMSSMSRNTVSYQVLPRQKQNLSVKKRTKPGIFVTSPKFPSTPRSSKNQISRITNKYDAQQIQSIKDSQSQIKMNESTISNNNNIHKMRKINQSLQNLSSSPQNKKQNILFPKKVSIYVESPRCESSILKQSINSLTVSKYQKRVINRSQLASNSSSSRLLTTKNKDKKIFNQILSPEQMKLLIIRKTINPKDTVNNKFFNELSRNMV